MLGAFIQTKKTKNKKRCNLRSFCCFAGLQSAMEILTHLINDTIEFYKWTLTIAGENFCSWDLRIRLF